MPDDPARRARERLVTLKESFKHQLGELLEQVEVDWHRLAHEGTDYSAQLQSLYNTMHRITGSAGSFGFSSVSVAAAPLEVLLGRLRETGQPPGEELRAQINRFIEQLLAAWHELHDDASPAMGLSSTPRRFSESGFDPGLVFALGDPQRMAQLSQQLLPFGYHLEMFDAPQALLEASQQDTPGTVLWFTEAHPLADWPAALQPVPVVVVNPLEGIQERLQAVRSGCRGYLQEPMNLADLLVSLEQLGRRMGQSGKPYRVLIIDDDETLAESFKLVLQLGDIGARVLCEPLSVLEVLAEDCPDLVLMDIHMPDCSGLELVQVIRQHLNYRHIPIVFLSTENDHRSQLQARLLGGDDFLAKPVYSRQLLEMVHNRAERGRSLRTASRQDELTGLLNQVGFRERLTVEMLRARRQTMMLSLGLVNLDHFQAFNQKYGYYRGDQVLKALTGMLSRRLRRTDIISRQGSGEFAIIFTDTPGADAQQVMDEIRESFASVELDIGNGESCKLTLSCGIADNLPDCDPGTLMARSRLALQAAKVSGRDQVVSHTPDLVVQFNESN